MSRTMQVSLLLAVLFTAAHAEKVTPVQKVIELLEGMLDKGKKEMQAEQVQFAAYKQFCEGTTEEKKDAIKEAEQAIVKLKADIEKNAADAEELGKQIAKHDEDISVWNGDMKAATKVREIEKTDYDALHKDYSESIDALERAILVLKRRAADKKQAAALMQVSALNNLNLIPKQAKQAINLFLMQEGGDSTLANLAPEANAYEFQSQGIIDMLQKLLDKFSDERTALEKAEVDSLHAYELLMQDTTHAVETATASRDEKQARKAQTLQAKADAEGDLTDTTTTMEDDKKYLQDLTATCETKASDFEQRQTLRAEEIEAIQKAIEIISSNAVAGASEKHLPQFLQTKSTSLAQLRSDGRSPTQSEAAKFLQRTAKKINSRMLAMLATKVADDPFGKVKKMIKDLITKLLEEANQEATQKGWCDTELGTNEQTRKEKTELVLTLNAQIDELGASISKLTEDMAELTEAIAAIDAAVAKATKIREEEKAKNTETIADAAAAQTAVAQALTVLNEFYAKAGEATAMLQQQPEAPEIFDSPYKGMAAEGGGVISMLEVIQSDFARLESETKAAEDAAQKEYDQFMQDSEVDKTAKTSDLEHKTQKKQDQEQSLKEKKADMEGTQKELDAALDYYEKLKPTCVGEQESYEETVARREEEIQSLKEALQILNGEGF